MYQVIGTKHTNWKFGVLNVERKLELAREFRSVPRGIDGVSY